MMLSRTTFVVLLLLAACFALSSHAYTPTPFIRAVDMAGIWRVSHVKSLLPKTTDNETPGDSDELILNLKGDGTFESTTDDGEDSSSLLQRSFVHGGSWVYEESMLKLASNREENARITKDTTLFGKVKVETVGSMQDEGLSSSEEQQPDYQVCLSMPHATVCIGKFMYPRKHKEFWKDPMLFDRSDVATVELTQILGNLNSRLEQERIDEIAQRNKVVKFHKKDFYNRSFYLSSQPLKVNPTYAARDLHYDESLATFDVRVIPITFHPNNTFTAQGSQKFLRGRYGITGEERDRLWFQVSLFGAGRSAPGSVYSEGAGLTHDDRRGYRGAIQQYEGDKNQTLLHVQGYIFGGNDLGIMKRPPTMGRFAMSEIADADLDYIDEDEDDEDEVIEEESFQ